MENFFWLSDLIGQELCFRKRLHLGNVHSGKRAMVISNSKKANLSASSKQRIKLQINGEKKLTFSEFLKDPSGMGAVINAKALQSYHLVEDTDGTYRGDSFKQHKRLTR